MHYFVLLVYYQHEQLVYLTKHLQLLQIVFQVVRTSIGRKYPSLHLPDIINMLGIRLPQDYILDTIFHYEKSLYLFPPTVHNIDAIFA